MKDVMIDLETLGTTSGSAIVSIGAVVFDMEKGLIGEKFHAVINLENINTREFTGGTLKWWLLQSGTARRALLAYTVETIQQALDDFKVFLPDDAVVWGNGASFDLGMLADAYDNNPPWEYYNERDLRTIMYVLQSISFSKYNAVYQREFVGVEHNALDDATHQAWRAIDAMKAIRGGLSE